MELYPEVEMISVAEIVGCGCDRQYLIVIHCDVMELYPEVEMISVAEIVGCGCDRQYLIVTMLIQLISFMSGIRTSNIQ